MMSKNAQLIVAALLSTTLLTAGAAFAADQPTPDQQKMTPQATAADKDFGKVSDAAANGFQDIMLTRIAIFNGRTTEAKDLVEKADRDFVTAKADDTVFLKAEAELKQPKSTAPDRTASTKAPAEDKDMAGAKKPIAWVPVEASVTINEDYTESPDKTAAVADANKSLKTGDRKGALEKLKLADMSIDLALAVVPLDATLASVHKASGLIGDGKYYEASQVLRLAQDQERFDVTTVPGAPKK
jgi:hypothetical protein